jgi:hypothetical protein
MARKKKAPEMTDVRESGVTTVTREFLPRVPEPPDLGLVEEAVHVRALVKLLEELPDLKREDVASRVAAVLDLARTAASDNLVIRRRLAHERDEIDERYTGLVNKVDELETENKRLADEVTDANKAVIQALAEYADASAKPAVLALAAWGVQAGADPIDARVALAVNPDTAELADLVQGLVNTRGSLLFGPSKNGRPAPVPERPAPPAPPPPPPKQDDSDAWPDTGADAVTLLRQAVAARAPADRRSAAAEDF